MQCRLAFDVDTVTQCLLCLLAASAQIPLLTPKEEPGVDSSRASSEQGEEEMEVDSNEEQDEEADPKAGGGGSLFNTLSTLSSLRPGFCTNPLSHFTDFYECRCSSQWYIKHHLTDTIVRKLCQ